MRSFFTGLFVIGSIVAVFVGFNSFFIVNEKEKALVMRLGEIKRQVNEPGLYFKAPFVEDVIRIEDRLRFIESSRKTVQVNNGERFEVDAILMLRIIDTRRYRETVQADYDLATSRLQRQLESALTQAYARRDANAALSKERAVMMREIRDEVKKGASALGLQIVDVRIRQTDLEQRVLEQAFERMIAERKAEAAQRIAIGTAEKQRITAEADRKYTELIAKAQRESEIIKGKGEANRNKIFAQAFSRDPEFFAFYRSMKAYESTLENGDATFVLSPDSEFFRYLKDPSGAAKK